MIEPNSNPLESLDIVSVLKMKFGEKALLGLINNELIPAAWSIRNEMIRLDIRADGCYGPAWLNRLAIKYSDLIIDDHSKTFISTKLTPTKQLYRVVIVQPHLLAEGDRTPDKAKKLALTRIKALHPTNVKDRVRVENAPLELVPLLRERLSNQELINMRMTDIVIPSKEELIDTVEYKKRILSISRFSEKTRISAYELEQERDNETGFAFIFGLEAEKQQQDNKKQNNQKGNNQSNKPNKSN